MRVSTAAACLLAYAAIATVPASAAETFSWSGTYEGYFVCDDVTAGFPSNFGRGMTVRVRQDGAILNVEIDSVVDQSAGVSAALYNGMIRSSPSGDIQSGFLEVCQPSFPYKELVRIFPAGTTGEKFGFSADTVFISDGLPGIEGKLIVESCKWSLDRVSAEVPEFDACPNPPSPR